VRSCYETCNSVFVRRRWLYSLAVFHRINCPDCARLISVNGNGQMRSHFCPHRNLCEPQRCRDCARKQLSTMSGSQRVAVDPACALAGSH
jgi:primosomal protein N'